MTDASSTHARFERLFPPDASPVVPAPFHAAKRLKGQQLHRDDWVREAVVAQSNGDLEYVAPAELSATQPGVTRPGVAYYLTDRFALTGDTYADQEKLSNRFPLVYVRESGEALILAGHHRSTAALLKQEHVLAIVIREPWNGTRASARLVTPRLVVGDVPVADHVPAVPTDDVAAAVRIIGGGQRVAVPTSSIADQIVELFR